MFQVEATTLAALLERSFSATDGRPAVAEAIARPAKCRCRRSTRHAATPHDAIGASAIRLTIRRDDAASANVPGRARRVVSPQNANETMPGYDY